jgi:uncharacterized protein YjbK
MLMSEQICLTALLTLPKPQQLGMIERLQQLNQQKKDLKSSKESISMERPKSCLVDK